MDVDGEEGTVNSLQSIQTELTNQINQLGSHLNSRMAQLESHTGAIQDRLEEGLIAMRVEVRDLLVEALGRLQIAAAPQLPIAEPVTANTQSYKHNLKHNPEQ